MNSVVLLSILGSVASLCSFLISSPSLKSKIIHAIYGFLLVVVVGSAFIYNQSKISELAVSGQKAQLLQEKIERMDSVKLGAKAILESKRYYSTTDTGENRGFILASFSFMEKNKSSFPESYAIAKKLIVDGLKISESANYFGEEKYNEQKRMEDGAAAMRELLQGISAGKI